MGVTRYFSEDNTYLARVTEITSTNAKCLTSFMGEVTIEWNRALPNPAPKVGEVWFVKKVGSSNWKFYDKATSGSYNAMHYAMLVDTRSCVGKERAVVDDIHKSGVDEVYLIVASDGVVMWDAEGAEDFKLKTFGDYVTQIVDRLSYYEIAITFVIDCELWPSNSDDISIQKYQQAYYDDEDQLQFANVFSPKAASAPIKYLVGDLYDKYRDMVRGVCFKNFGLVNGRADFSAANRIEYFSRYNVEPDISFIKNESDSETWYGQRIDWVKFQTEMYSEFLKDIQDGIGNWPISAIVTDDHMYNGASTERLGRLHSGIDDDFSKLNWSRVGMPLSLSVQSDSTAVLRSFEYLVAYEKRLAKYSAPLYVVGVDENKDYDAALDILSRYDADVVLFDDYDKWKLLSDKDILDLDSAMKSYRVVEKSDQDYAGILMSSNSRDITCFSVSDNRKWHSAIDNLSSIMLDSLPHRLKVFFDEDINIEDGISDVAMVVLFMTTNMTDDGIDNICETIKSQGRSVVIAGIAGSKEFNANIDRVGNKILNKFDQKSSGNREYSKLIHINKNRMDVAGSVFLFDDSLNSGIIPAFPDETASGFEQIIVADNYDYDNVQAPIYFNGRSSFMGIDPYNDKILLSIVGELILYALGRNA